MERPRHGVLHRALHVAHRGEDHLEDVIHRHRDLCSVEPQLGDSPCEIDLRVRLTVTADEDVSCLGVRDHLRRAWEPLAQGDLYGDEVRVGALMCKARADRERSPGECPFSVACGDHVEFGACSAKHLDVLVAHGVCAEPTCRAVLACRGDGEDQKQRGEACRGERDDGKQKRHAFTRRLWQVRAVGRPLYRQTLTTRRRAPVPRAGSRRRTGGVA